MSSKVYCNMCGKELDFWDRQEGFSIHTHCGYGTKYDGEYIELDLCCECMENLVEKCEISPISNNT